MSRTLSVLFFLSLSIFAFDERRGRDKVFRGLARLWRLKRWKLGGNGGESGVFPKQDSINIVCFLKIDRP